MKKADTLLLILLAAFAVRFALSWHPGYGFDIGVYQGWARSAVELGMAHSYTEQIGGNMLPDYPPFSIMILTGFGHVYKLLFGAFDMSSTSYWMFIKLPAILSDVLICVLLYVAVRRWKSEREGTLAALAYALNPAAIYDSALWGQTDAIYSLILLAAVMAWLWKKYDLAAVMLALSILTKMQSIVLFPLFAFLLLPEPKKLLRFSIIGVLTMIAVLIPFLLGDVLENVAKVYTGSVGAYSNVTIGAYNFWWAMLADEGWRLQSSDSPFGLVSYGQIGIMLFGVMYALILWIFRNAARAVRDGTAFRLYHCAALLCMAFFLFLPQMHERYLFPFVVFGLPLIFISRGIAAAYWVAIVAFTVNLMGVMPLTFIDKALFRELDSLDVFMASTLVWVFVYLMCDAYRRYGRVRG